MIDAFLKRARKWGFSKDVSTFNEFLINPGLSLFQKRKESRLPPGPAPPGLQLDFSGGYYVRNKHFGVSSIKDLFENVEAQDIIDFITESRVISNFNVFILIVVN